MSVYFSVEKLGRHMRSPIHSLKQRIIALVRREVETSVANENLDGLRRRVSAVDVLAKDNEFLIQNVILRLDSISHDLQALNSRIRAEPYRSAPIGMVSSFDGLHTIGFDTADKANYAGFVDIFRPSFEDLYIELTHLNRWFPSSGDAVDLGAGRGEMVKVMSDYGLKSFGIDSDKSVVSAAVERGLDVRELSIDDFFSSAQSDSFDLVTAIQVVEHVDTKQLESWFSAAKRILKDGGIFLVETPNPHAIDAFKAFWIDVTHVRPYYPESLLHMTQTFGFRRAEIWAPGTQSNINERLEFAGSYVLIATA